MAETTSFQNLMDDLRAGEEQAASEVFHRFANRLIGLARTRLDQQLRIKEDPEDVVQSVYRSFYARYAEDRFDLESWDSLWALLVLITVRKCARRHERFRAAQRDISREVRAPATESGPQTEAMGRDPSPDEAALLNEAVAGLLAQLDDRDREMVVLALQGHSTREISDQVDRTERTVRRVLERIRKRLERSRDESV